MLMMPAPQPLVGRLLAEEFASAGLVTGVAVDGSTLRLSGLGESDRSAAESVVAAHPVTAQAHIDSLAGEQVNETTIRDRATTALADNKAFLAIASPTNAQNAAQVKALTRQVNGLIRMVLRRFESAD